MMTRLLKVSLLGVAFAGLLIGATAHEFVPGSAASSEVQTPADLNLAIVVNVSNPADKLSTGELRRIFLGERGNWPNGRRITIVMMEPGQPERAVILREVCQMTETQFNNHFLHGVFTGQVLVSPKTLATPAGVRKFIFNVPGAIGYLRASDVDSTVKVLRIDERAPSDKGYPLHVPPRPSK
jgi:hypothetical protein